MSLATEPLFTDQAQAKPFDLMATAATAVRTGELPPNALFHAAGYRRWGRWFGEPHELPSAADDFFTRHRLRDSFINEYGFAIMSREARDALLALGPLVEVGAGTGYWSAVLKGAGGDVIATDIVPAGRTSSFRQKIGAHCPVGRAAAAAAIRLHPHRAVLSVWPYLRGTWPNAMVKAVTPGQVFAYVGEGPGGATGTDAMHARLERDFDEVAEVEIPQFEGMHDSLVIYRRHG